MGQWCHIICLYVNCTYLKGALHIKMLTYFQCLCSSINPTLQRIELTSVQMAFQFGGYRRSLPIIPLGSVVRCFWMFSYVSRGLLLYSDHCWDLFAHDSDGLLPLHHEWSYSLSKSLPKEMGQGEGWWGDPHQRAFLSSVFVPLLHYCKRTSYTAKGVQHKVANLIK